VLDTQRRPASSAVVVAGLGMPGCLLEIEAYALVDD
jgi:enamine deaminase RidA (YjgF/YER057c/UK114 family)